MTNTDSKYFLETSLTAQARLRLLHVIYGPSTDTLLSSIGIAAGMHAVDVGCGLGAVTQQLARYVGQSGHVVGVDMSPEHLAVARQDAAERGARNITWRQASAYETGLPRGSFDVVYCRFLLEHLDRPAAALEEMDALLKPNGLLVCESINVATLATEPAQSVYARVVDLILQLHRMRGSDGQIGPKLPGLFQKLGYATPSVKFDQPVYLRGEEKRFWEQSFLETTPAMIREKVVQPEEVQSLSRNLSAISSDETILVAHAIKVQSWARKAH